MKLNRYTIELRNLKGLDGKTEKFSLKPTSEVSAAFNKSQGTPDYDRIIFKANKAFIEYDYEGYEWRGPKLTLYLGDRTRYDNL